MSPLVSILIPHYNRNDLLAETLVSVSAQTYDNWEGIVVDDQSSDEAWRAIKHHTEDSRIRVIKRLSEPRGPSKCRNIALDKARGEFILFLT